MRARRWMTTLAVTVLSTAAWTCLAARTAVTQSSHTPWVAPERRARRPNPVRLDSASVAAGRAVYRRECIKCHGPSGANDGTDNHGADMSQAPKLNGPEAAAESDGALFWKISEGKDPMPSTAETLTDTERWQVVNYIRALQRRAGH